MGSKTVYKKESGSTGSLLKQLNFCHSCHCAETLLHKFEECLNLDQVDKAVNVVLNVVSEAADCMRVVYEERKITYGGMSDVKG